MMPAISLATAIEVGAAAACLLVAWSVLWYQRVRKTPPGPMWFPLIGNMWSLPAENRWLKIDKLARTYGDVIYFEDWSDRILALNSYEAVHELLENRAQNYSDRTQTHMMSILRENGDPGFGLMDFGPNWAAQRKLFVQHLNKLVIKTYFSTIDHEARVYVDRALKRPQELVSLLRLMAARLILKVAYGIEVDSMEHKFVQMPEKTVLQIGLALRPHFYLVDQFPILKKLPDWLPGMEFLRSARNVGKMSDRMMNEPWDLVVQQLAEGTAKPSVTSRLLENGIGKEYDMKRVSGSMYTAGADTTTTTLQCFFLAMLIFPEVQRKAQEEIDRVVGRDRLPSLDDRKDLPYIEGVVKETFRWFVIAPLALTHVVREDDVYNGFVIPKGTMILPNSWAISQDPKLYPQPEIFMPERFMPEVAESMGLPSPAMDPKRFVGGYGRRVCPGLDFANLSVWSTIATVLATMNVRRAKDAQGREIVPKAERDDSGAGRPKPFEYRIEPRSAASTALLGDSVVNATL